jgi:hypothetical protein
MRKIAHVVSKMTLAEARLEPTNHSHSGMAPVQVLFIRLQNGLCSGTDRFDPLRISPPTPTKPGTHLIVVQAMHVDQSFYEDRIDDALCSS